MTGFCSGSRRSVGQAYPVVVAGMMVILSLFPPASALAGDASQSDFRNPQGGDDVIVAPVKRVFPKTPTDRDLARLSKTKIAKKKTAKKARPK